MPPLAHGTHANAGRETKMRLSDNARAELLSWAIALFAVVCLCLA